MGGLRKVTVTNPSLTDIEAWAFGVLLRESLLGGTGPAVDSGTWLTALRASSAGSGLDRSDLDSIADALARLGLLQADRETGDGAAFVPTVSDRFDLDPAQVAALALLCLHGPLTASELVAVDRRLYPFRDPYAATSTLESLEHVGHGPLVVRERAPSPTAEPRFRHTLSASGMAPPASPQAASVSAPHPSSVEDNLEGMLAELDRLVSQLARRR